jgi:hypothetical protein
MAGFDTSPKYYDQAGIDWYNLPTYDNLGLAQQSVRGLDPSQLVTLNTGQEGSVPVTIPAWLLGLEGIDPGGASTNAMSSFVQRAAADAQNPMGGDVQYYYQANNMLTPDGGGYSGYVDPESFIRIRNDDLYKQAVASGQKSILNDRGTYDILDRAGNVIDTRAWTGLKDEDHWDRTVQTLVGLALGGIGATAAAGGAAGASGAAGVTGLGDAGMMYAGADAAAAGSLGGGASIGGGAALGAGGAAGAGAGAGYLGDASAWGYGGAPDAFGATGASTMGGGASVGGGAALGSAGGSGSWLDTFRNGASSMTGGTGGTNWLGLGATALGALGGAQGQDASSSATRAMDPRMDSLFYGDLAPRTQGLLGSQLPQAAGAGQQMMSVGSGLLGTNRTPDVFGSQFYQGAANDLQSRTKDLLDQNNQSIRGNAVAYGGLGGSRQGVSEGVAAGKAADYLQGNLSQLALNQYNQDSNRNLQAITLGSGLLSQGLNTQWAPIQQAAQTYSPFTGFGTTTQNQSSGGGAMGALGGALGAAQFSRNMGWLGNGSSGTTSGGWW